MIDHLIDHFDRPKSNSIIQGHEKALRLKKFSNLKSEIMYMPLKAVIKTAKIRNLLILNIGTIKNDVFQILCQKVLEILLN